MSSSCRVYALRRKRAWQGSHRANSGSLLAAARSIESGSSSKPSPGFDPSLFVKTLTTGKTSLDYEQGDAVFSQGDDANSVCYIESGKVKLTVVSKRGKEAVVALLTEGSFLGEGCPSGQPLRMASATAIPSCAVTCVEKTVMIDQLHRESEFAELFLSFVLSRNIRMEADLVDHLFNSSEKRLARLLLLLANFGQESKLIPVIAKMSQEALAEMIGTTRSQVSFFLNRFRQF